MKDASETYAPGDVIFHQGDLGTEMYIIDDGEVQIVKNISGESHVLSKLEKGDFFVVTAKAAEDISLVRGDIEALALGSGKAVDQGQCLAGTTAGMLPIEAAVCITNLPWKFWVVFFGRETTSQFIATRSR